MAPGVDLVQVLFDRNSISADEDDAVITMHCRGLVAGLPDDLGPMDDGKRAAFATRIITWWGLIKGNFTSNMILRDIKFYALGNDIHDPMGPPDKIVTPSLPGTGGTGILPLQSALSVTFRTANRKQWGRFYLPGATTSVLTNGRITNAVCDALASATQGLTSRSGTDACLTVWSRVGWTHHDPQQVQVDNIPDVIKSRRLRQTTYRKQISAG